MEEVACRRRPCLASDRERIGHARGENLNKLHIHQLCPHTEGVGVPIPCSLVARRIDVVEVHSTSGGNDRGLRLQNEERAVHHVNPERPHNPAIGLNEARDKDEVQGLYLGMSVCF